ncbi:cyclic-amp phosphodiesterase [Moniliophthora roreri MCA 2997]|uniref:Cyclic-amp phosphodiesterase n=2 Tax=Moniliophthora roreri TaxID=221103 RepID=V2Y777_MONRO|nr:cyclic-amp phosphodiesterase [Moniliophthora roreri MCA 2997]KAI3610743.1 cyclic-amp phosphodiesterase [Moniliophthora roreri]
MSPPPAFDMVVVGSGGGPDETNLSSYLLKPARKSWEAGIIALEAGSGPGALRRLLNRNPNLFGEPRSAADIYSFIRCYLLSHAHLDHINGLVISAGTLEGPRKRVYGVKKALEDLETVFADRIWPNLASWKEDDADYKLLYSTVSVNGSYQTIFPDVSVQTMIVNHGCNQSGAYDSAAFFIRDDISQREFVFFGDVEPDSLAPIPRTINVWCLAAPKIPDTLSSIFIECSWPAGRSNDSLYGHLNPEHLTNELTTLATEVYYHRNAQQTTVRSAKPQRKRQKRNPPTVGELRGILEGVRVYIIHCKDSLEDLSHRPMREVIWEQVKSLMDPLEFGVEIISAAPGMHIGRSLFHISVVLD